MATETNVAQLNGFFKDRYGELVNAIPDDMDEILKEVPFSKSELLGKSFIEDVILSNEHGWTRGGTDGSAFDLDDPVPMATDGAQIVPYSFMMNCAMSYTAQSRASGAGKSGNAQAFADAVMTVIERSNKAQAFYIAVATLYGQSPNGIGRVVATAVLDIDATNHYLVFTDAQWAPLIWSGAEGARLNLHRSDTGALIGTNGTTDTVFSVAAVDNKNRRVKITGTAQGIIDSETANDTVNLIVYFKDGKTKDFPGMEKVFSNTSGIVHDIDASVFGLWAGNTENVSGQLTKGKILQYVAGMVGRGLKEDVVVRVSCNTWGNLEQDEIALQVFDQSYNPAKAESGVESIWYRGQNGRIEVRSDGLVKGGDMFIYPRRNRLKRLGSADQDFNIPGQESDPFFPLQKKAGFGWRNLSDQAFYCQAPAKCFFGNGILNA